MPPQSPTPANDSPSPERERQAEVGGAQQAGEPQTDRAGGAPQGSSGHDADSPAALPITPMPDPDA